MWTNRRRLWSLLFCILFALCAFANIARGEVDEDEASETKCKEYVRKALKELETGEVISGENDDSDELVGSNEVVDDDDDVTASIEIAESPYRGHHTNEQDDNDDSNETADDDDDDSKENDNDDDDDQKTGDEDDDDDDDDDSKEVDNDDDDDDNSKEADDDSKETGADDDGDSKEADNDDDSKENETAEDNDGTDNDDDDSKEDNNDNSTAEDDGDSKEDDGVDSQEDDNDTAEKDDDDSKGVNTDTNDDDDSKEDTADGVDSKEGDDDDDDTQDSGEDDDDEDDDDDSKEEKEPAPEEDLLLETKKPKNLRSRKHIYEILRLNDNESENEKIIERSYEIVLRDVKKIYENSIKPLETLYKYRDLSNRHFGDPEIFSKPLVLFMGPWSGGKSTIINYLTGLEYTKWSLRTGAEPSPAYFNILMWGNESQVLDGTQLAADYTFSGLQKFGQGLEERLRGLKHPSKLLEKVNIVEIPGILEVRKQVSRVFPFNDACQWFIDRADIIFLVYDPSKLDVGPETEAILDQLKGRETHTRIVLNKADTVKPEELLRVQSALIWNISPLMSSAQPPAMYTVSLWSVPFNKDAPQRLLLAQEREMLKDLRLAIDRRIENKIASARRFAVRVRNHAKMVDCYLTTFYNHKTIFGNKKVIADAIIENPQNYHIYEGLSTLTNISRYDLPDPETYKDFFRLNNLYDFQQLSATCTYFRGCPINKLDVAIAYDLPDLVGKYKKMVENATPQGMPKT